MAGSNGTMAGGVLRLPDLSPERMSIVVQRDGEEVTLAGYVRGKRCPIPVTIQQEAAFQQFQEARQESNLTPADFMGAYLLYARDSLKAVIPGLTDDEANIIAGDEELRQEILVNLKWWVKTAVVDDPEAGAVATETVSPSTTATSSPDSASPTQEPAPSTGTPT